ncbi:MAG: DNA recombination protein RmuC [bacterium]|nr:DNA recombination protein RmuC [bacterium]
MDPNMYLILALIVAGFGLTLMLVRRWLVQQPKTDAALTEWLKSMQASVETTNKTLNEAMRGTSADMAKVLQENTRQLNDRLDNAAKVISAVQKNLGEMSEVGRGIKSLQEFLQSPKLRGGLGEEILGQMIGQTIPKNSFHLQYTFKSGVKVDAVLKTDSGLLCIDSKFPMENFSRLVKGDSGAKKDFIADVKKHISDIAKKYILPDEGTTDFALMYIPSESVYYEVVNTPEIMSFSRSTRIYPVSPSTFYAHLQIILTSFQGKDLEAKSKQVFQLLRAIQKDYTKVEENMSVLGRHITNAHNQMSNVSSSFGLLGQKLSQTQSLPQPDDSQT